MRTLRQATLVDLPIVIGIFEHIHGEQEVLAFYLRSKIKNTFENTYLLSSDNSYLLIFERIGVSKCQFHVYPAPGAEKVPLKEKKAVLLNGLKYIKDVCGYTSIITFVPEGNRVAEVSAKSVGFKLIGNLKDAGGVGCTERIYAYEVI